MKYYQAMKWYWHAMSVQYVSMAILMISQYNDVSK